MDSLDSVKLTRVEKILESVKKHYQDSPERIDDIELSFEFIIGSLFPDVYNNILEALNREHTLGYMEGLKENESKRNN